MDNLKTVIENFFNKNARHPKLRGLVLNSTPEWSDTFAHSLENCNDLALAIRVCEAVFDDDMYNALLCYDESINRKWRELVTMMRNGEMTTEDGDAKYMVFRAEAEKKLIEDVKKYFC